MKLGKKAKNVVKKLFEFAVKMNSSRYVRIRNIRLGKYAGRIVADVEIKKTRSDDFIDLKSFLISYGLAKPYDGGHKSSWCQK